MDQQYAKRAANPIEPHTFNVVKLLPKSETGEIWGPPDTRPMFGPEYEAHKERAWVIHMEFARFVVGKKTWSPEEWAELNTRRVWSWAASDVKSVVKYAKTEYRELYDGAPQLAEKYGYPKFPHMKMVKP